MKKHLFFFIIAISLLVMSSHVRGQGVDLRSVVAVVRVNNCESSKTFLKEYGAMLRKDGYTEGADWIESYIEGGFGSGFTY